ncbi:Crp/Fnr family transcriptional regulator [Terrimonas sp. NA20]|uniref:Crp/Fnr family transcriptional regulator n=1 Tax=Terrimonas ginsenosidimutans TaxID=2908004 RepID=A0ABS9KQU7_9BACT|nr:Crp/Fnr family transcriptional regulator [Terrimonas ginsenosidimutans]MCG2614708.1 Crp/Fnr family transcriptional regulator [Terrimonas ginsenosidimutans]
MSVQQLHTFIQAIYPLKEKEWEAFSSIWTPFECKRKTMLTAIGETEKHLYFVLEGLQRAFYIGEDNQEGTIVFTYPPSFSGVADSFLTQTPSKYFFETLSTSKFLRTTYKQMEELMLQYPDVQGMVLRITAFALKGVLERQVELQCFSAEEKFRTLLKRSPHVLQIIPHKYLASYLGIDPATFSKLLSSKRI